MFYVLEDQNESKLWVEKEISFKLPRKQNFLSHSLSENGY